MKRFIVKYYDFIFRDEDQKEQVPYANKLFMFIFSLTVFIIIIILIILDILENIS